MAAEARLGKPHEVCVPGKATYGDLAVIAQSVSRLEAGLVEEPSGAELEAEAERSKRIAQELQAKREKKESAAASSAPREQGAEEPAKETAEETGGTAGDAPKYPTKAGDSAESTDPATLVATDSPHHPVSTPWVPAKRVRFATAFQWQLRDAQEVAELRRWEQQPLRSSSLAGAPWNIKSGDIVVFRDSAEVDLLQAREFDPTQGLRPWAGRKDVKGGAAGGPREQAFHILSAQERRERAEARKKEEDEAARAQSSAAAAMAKAKGVGSAGGGAGEAEKSGEATGTAASSGAAVVDGHDLGRFVRMLAVGVGERQVGIAMASEGLDVALLHRAIEQLDKAADKAADKAKEET